MNLRVTLILIIVLLSSNSQAQDYVNIVKFFSNNSFLKNDQDNQTSNAYNQFLEVYYPIRANEKWVVITGTSFENTTLDLLAGSGQENLLMLRLNLGFKHKHSEKWTGTYLVLPKIASDFKKIGLRDLQIGGLMLWECQVSELWKIKFGAYVSSESHGSTITPLIGAWFRSRNRKFYINAVLPIRMDINYSIVKGFSIGAALTTSVKSYDLSTSSRNAYVQENSIRAGAYLSYGFLDNSLIFRIRGGYDATDYGLYNSSDVLGAQLLLFPLSGDHRNRLNPSFTGGGYIGGDFIYRFDLRKEKKK